MYLNQVCLVLLSDMFDKWTEIFGIFETISKKHIYILQNILSVYLIEPKLIEVINFVIDIHYFHCGNIENAKSLSEKYIENCTSMA